ncbi:hypothetical protein B0H10DRAFT_1102438 [Mycena sp. CBHHK59/15]|nr:hypothetical protein B0H10DRAFT_1102438 [Mycena sp. CBHHK59/15]
MQWSGARDQTRKACADASHSFAVGRSSFQVRKGPWDANSCMHRSAQSTESSSTLALCSTREPQHRRSDHRSRGREAQ